MKPGKSFIVFTASVALMGSYALSSIAQSKKSPPNKAVKTAPKKPTSISEDQFMARLQERIANTPNNIPVDKNTSVVVLLKISGTGSLENVLVKQSSGIEELDKEAIGRVKQAAPFGPMPDSLRTGLDLTYTFQFQAALRAGPSKSVDTGPYMEKLAQKVANVWSAPEVAKDCKVTVHFILDAGGGIKSLTVSKPSGFKVVDDRASEAIKRAAPYGELPEGLSSMPVNYMFSAGPKDANLKKYQFNGKPLEEAGWQISRSGSTLKPLNVDNKLESKLKERNWKILDQISALKDRLAKGADQTTKAEILTNIGRNYRKINDYENATKSFEEAASIFKEENSADVAVLEAELAEAYAKKGDTENAIKLFDKAVSTLREHKQENGIELKNALTEYAKTLYKLNKVDEANKLYAEVRSLK